MAASVELVVADNAEAGRYEARLGSEVVGFITYRLHPERITLIHTEVAQALEGLDSASMPVAVFAGSARCSTRRRDRGSTSTPPNPDEIAETVLTCPTGALHFRRVDGGEQETAATETTVEPLPNGPLLVRGRLKIVDAEGRVIREDTRLALCRCGASGNKPFCDGSHRRVGFTTAAERNSG